MPTTARRPPSRPSLADSGPRPGGRPRGGRARRSITLGRGERHRPARLRRAWGTTRSAASQGGDPATPCSRRRGPSSAAPESFTDSYGRPSTPARSATGSVTSTRLTTRRAAVTLTIDMQLDSTGGRAAAPRRDDRLSRSTRPRTTAADSGDCRTITATATDGDVRTSDAQCRRRRTDDRSVRATPSTTTPTGPDDLDGRPRIADAGLRTATRQRADGDGRHAGDPPPVPSPPPRARRRPPPPPPSAGARTRRSWPARSGRARSGFYG